MSLIPYRPWWDLDRFFGEDWWSEFPRIVVPALRAPRMDIYEDNGNVVAKVELPGVDPKNIEVEIKDNVLKVEAGMEQTKEEKEKGYYHKELSRGYYKRAVPLPVEVIGEKALATYEGGILKIAVPKAKPKKGKKAGVRIKVQTKTA